MVTYNELFTYTTMLIACVTLMVEIIKLIISIMNKK